MEMAVKMVKRAAARGTPSPPPVSWGAPPLSPLPSWLLGSPPPWRWDPWGRQKRGFGGCKFVGGDALGELGFLPLYSFSDSRHPILGCSKSGLKGPSGL